MTAIKEQADTCFVCITGNGSIHPKAILFYSDSKILKQMAKDGLPAATHLLYYRHFTNMFDALAHKLMLENLGDTSLNCIISRRNPGWEDLREGLEEALGVCICDEIE